MRIRSLIPLLLLFLHSLPAQARWEGARDNKSSTQLAAMTNQQLFDEAFDVCVRRALLESLPEDSGAQHSLTECNEYFSVLTPFVRERNAGKIPPWMNALETAHTTKECQGAFHGFVSKAEKPATAAPTPEEAHKAAAESPPVADADAAEAPRAHRVRPLKPTPAQPRSHWTEQLPPWVAPH